MRAEGTATKITAHRRDADVAVSRAGQHPGSNIEERCAQLSVIKIRDQVNALENRSRDVTCNGHTIKTLCPVVSTNIYTICRLCRTDAQSYNYLLKYICS